MRVHIVLTAWHLDVGSAFPPGVKTRKGSAVRRLTKQRDLGENGVFNQGNFYKLSLRLLDKKAPFIKI